MTKELANSVSLIGIAGASVQIKHLSSGKASTGPEAMLPLCGSFASLVWYHSVDEITRLSALSDAAFLEALVDTFPDELGGIRAVVQRGSFPIAKAHAATYIADRLALVGDAAHTVHPLAGQGVNLGMLDAAALAEVVLQALDQGKDPGSRRQLRKFERWRRTDNALMIAVLDGFYHTFKPQPAPIRQVRSLAMNLADRDSPLKRFIMRQAMGTQGDLPVLAKSRPGRLVSQV